MLILPSFFRRLSVFCREQITQGMLKVYTLWDKNNVIIARALASNNNRAELSHGEWDKVLLNTLKEMQLVPVKM